MVRADIIDVTRLLHVRQGVLDDVDAEVIGTSRRSVPALRSVNTSSRYSPLRSS